MRSSQMNNMKFKQYFEKKVMQTIKKTNMFSFKDKIGAAVSGGKDSTVCLYILKKLGYDVQAITIDAAIGNYTKKNLENLKKVCDKYGIKLHVVEFRKEFGMSLCYIRSVLKEKGHEYSSCMLCGILKRYLLNKYARKLKFDYLATGHNLDDEAQAFVMNIIRNDLSRAQRQGPIPGVSKSKKFVRRVKPLYNMSEAEITRFSKLMKFPVNYGICPCSTAAFRRNFVNILDDLEKKFPDIKYNIIKFHENMLKSMKKTKSEKVNSCEICGEPASGKICKTCTIFKDLIKD